MLYPIAPEKSTQSNVAETSVRLEATNPPGVEQGGAGVLNVVGAVKLLLLPLPQSL